LEGAGRFCESALTVGAFASFIARENPNTREFKRRRKDQEIETRID
jgi:hypothetical protein